jgi:hypothetical protein
MSPAEQSDKSGSLPFIERKHKMAKKRKVAKKAVKKKKAAKGLWTSAEVKLLRKLFPTNPTSRIAARLGRKTDAVKKKASRMKLRKSRQYLKTLGRA